jgi:hypothetical protein
MKLAQLVQMIIDKNVDEKMNLLCM